LWKLAFGKENAYFAGKPERKIIRVLGIDERIILK
jgi:hypothetical protein